ncbi:MAG TPA: plastocyanin/azurin family copper-binding protein [Candidatus Eremiobacteraceae bacterium]|nr:plastocyanin/azurin family copper-binding protein [Candidatus Eremiobacteraceae bacterium]
MKKIYWAAVLIVVLGSAACTPGAVSNPSGAGISAGAVVVHVSLLKFGKKSSQYGEVAGYSPNVITVQHGATIQFINDDTFLHTASSVGTNGFPPNPVINSHQSGRDVADANWSSGELNGGSASQVFTTNTPGTYYFGCFFHYLTPMRGVIVVQ